MKKQNHVQKNNLRFKSEISKRLLDELPIVETAVSVNEQTAFNQSELRVEEVTQFMNDLYCLGGADLTNEDARIQYEKYKAFAGKKKLEISRKIKRPKNRPESIFFNEN